MGVTNSLSASENSMCVRYAPKAGVGFFILFLFFQVMAPSFRKRRASALEIGKVRYLQRMLLLLDAFEPLKV